jgi:hypothetical protein
MVHVFTYSFEFLTAPGPVQFHCRQMVAKWGIDLDTAAPVAVRTFVFRMMRRWGVPGTPIV